MIEVSQEWRNNQPTPKNTESKMLTNMVIEKLANKMI